MINMKLTVCILSAMVSLFTTPFAWAAPLVENNKNTDRDKRSDEVIFFENGAQGGEGMKKRSEAWPILGNQPKHTDDKTTEKISGLAVLPKNSGSQLSEPNIEGNDFTEQMNEWLVEQELNEFVNKLIAEAFQDELNEYLQEQHTNVFTTERPVPRETTMMIVAEPTESLNEETDEEAKELSYLVVDKQDSMSTPYANFPIEADEPYYQENKAYRYVYDNQRPAYGYNKDQLQMRGTESSAASSTDKYMEINMVDSQQPAYKREDGEHNAQGIIKDFKYLEELTALEKKLREELANFKQMTARAEIDSEEDRPHSRKRRNVEDGWFEEGEREPRNNKICFTSEEVRQLREILVELAKERLDSEKIIKFLIKEKQEEPTVVYDQPEADRWLNSDILIDEQDGARLDNLALRLRQDRQPAVYGGYNEAAKRRSYYSPY